MKLKLIIAFGIGYVLGTRAGRQRYDEIRDAATRLGEDPRVRDVAEKAEGKVRETVDSVRETAGREASGSAEGGSATRSEGDGGWPEHPDDHVEVPEDEVVYSSGPESR